MTGILAMLAGSGGGAPEFVSTSFNSTTGTSVVVTAPTGIQDGMMLISAYEGETSGSPNITVPSGFSNVIYAYNTSGNQVNLRYKIASSESGDYTFSHDGSSSKIAASISVYRYVTGLDLAGTALENSSTASLTAPSFTPTVNGTLIFAGFRPSDSGTVSSDPAGMTQRLANTSASAMYLYDLQNNPPGATGTKTLTLGTSRTSWAVMFQIY